MQRVQNVMVKTDISRPDPVFRFSSNKTMYTEELSNHNELITQLLNKIIRELGYSYDYEKLKTLLREG